MGNKKLTQLILDLVKHKYYKKEVILERVNTFYAYGQITKQQYEEIMNEIKKQYDTE